MDSVDHAMMPPKIPDVGVGCLVDGKAHVVSVCQTHRAACLDFLGKNTKARRSVFARVAPRSFRWLLHNDTEWFDRHCPVFRREHIQSELF